MKDLQGPRGLLIRRPRQHRRQGDLFQATSQGSSKIQIVSTDRGRDSREALARGLRARQRSRTRCLYLGRCLASRDLFRHRSGPTQGDFTTSAPRLGHLLHPTVDTFGIGTFEGGEVFGERLPQTIEGYRLGKKYHTIFGELISNLRVAIHPTVRDQKSLAPILKLADPTAERDPIELGQ